jgi:hypothetical protein
MSETMSVMVRDKEWREFDPVQEGIRLNDRTGKVNGEAVYR